MSGALPDLHAGDPLGAETEHGKPIPIDLEPRPDGNIVLSGFGGVEDRVAHVLGAGETTSAPRYVSHFATCPDAETHRRRRRRSGVSEHVCPAPGCSFFVDDEQLACSRHWYSIPKELRDELWRAYRGGGCGTARHVAAVNACISFLESKTAA